MQTFKTEHGFIEWCQEENDAVYVDYIEAKIKGNNNGSRLMQSFIEERKKKGTKYISLLACDRYGVNICSLERFYNKLGFKSFHQNSFGIDMEMEI